MENKIKNAGAKHGAGACTARAASFSSDFRLCRWSLIGAVFILACLSAGVYAGDGAHPFKPGEKLKYVLKWGVISAGEAELAVLPIADVNGTRAYHFVMTAKSNSFVDVFYKVRDRIDAYADVNMQHSLLYKKKQREGGYKRDVVVNFDWDKQQATYTNKGKTREPIGLKPGSFDPLSAFYFTRIMKLTPGLEISQPITDGRKNVIGAARVKKRETIEVNGRSYDTFLIIPDLNHIGGVFKESKNAKIHLWVTADERHIPVRLKSKVVVGSFVGELISVEGALEP